MTSVQKALAKRERSSLLKRLTNAQIKTMNQMMKATIITQKTELAVSMVKGIASFTNIPF